MSLKPKGKTPQLSTLDSKDTILLLSTPSDTFHGFSYISPNIITFL